MDDIELLHRELARERAARKQAEQLLEQKSLEVYHRNRELEAQVAARTRVELSLREHAEELARTNDELEQFAYVASHDLQAPLRGITSFSQLLERRAADRLDDECRDYLQFISDGARRLHAVINDLLAYSQAGRGELNARLLSLAEVLGRALAELRAELRATGAEVSHGDLPAVQGDPTLLTQLLRNLIDNAIKYVPPGVPPRVRVEASTRDSAVVVRIGDNGIGIGPEHCERIFQMFQRLHTEDEYPGTGIGLAICKKIVERHGGRLWVEQPEAGGSSFCFSLPLMVG